MNEELSFRKATAADLVDIVAMLADDELGAKREDYKIPLPDSYHRAFELIRKDPQQELTVLLLNDKIIAVFQLTFIQYLTYKGGIRAQIEGVRVHSDYRGQGYGHSIFEYAINRAKKKGAHMLQLTTDKKRPEAIAFYKSLGFEPSHEGMKLHF